MFVILGNKLFLGIKSELSINNPNINSLNELDQFIEQHKGEYMLCFISYDLKNSFETLKSDNDDNIQFPVIKCIVPAEIKTLSSLNDLIDKNLPKHEEIIFQPALNKEEYQTCINKIKQHIQLGDIYETNFCYQWTAKTTSFNGVSIYKKLKQLTEAPFAVYADLEDHIVISASPERYLKKTGEQLLSQPIKGTARRGRNKKEDNTILEQLKNDPKERTENIMIVDLVRNDLSKIAVKNSVKVKNLCAVHTFKNIHQMISDVSCTLKEGILFSEVLRATFPMGSMTGVPKIRAMKLMEKYESSKRGLYSGSIGLISPNGDFDMSVIIRTLLYNKKNQCVSFSVGGAITIDSDPLKEYEETITKASSILEACK